MGSKWWPFVLSLVGVTAMYTFFFWGATAFIIGVGLSLLEVVSPDDEGAKNTGCGIMIVGIILMAIGVIGSHFI